MPKTSQKGAIGSTTKKADTPFQYLGTFKIPRNNFKITYYKQTFY